MRVTATVPMRVDLAGGTLDVYPLYIFEGGGLTVNAAVDILAHVRVETRSDAVIAIASEDLQAQEVIPAFRDITFGGPLDLVKRALAYYRPESGLDISLRSEAPRGSGIGASSALLMALSSCLNEITGRGLTREQIIDVGANIEAQVVGIPTGKQDYFPPIYGGVCSIWFDVDGWRLEPLALTGDLVAELNRRLIVSFTGIPHSSAVTNWAMLKAYIEKQGDTVARMREIRAIAQEMRDCLAAGDLGRLPELLDREWMLRKGLADGVTTLEIETIMAAARRAGALASKICGAGGGGCMITLAEPNDVVRVSAALKHAGAEILPARLVTQGLRMAVDA
jgi:D-glycero-alpha-D-manno-heptose-7-phosphate kinase